MSASFFNQINYSSCNEDSEAELKALKITPVDDVFCITGSGARTLDLLVADPRRLVSIDFNPTQNHLLELKIAGMRRLDYGDYLQLLGHPIQVRPRMDASSSLWKTVESDLSVDSREFWNRNQHLIERGLLYCGTWERLLGAISNFNWIRRKHVLGLWEAADLATQVAYWEKHWAGTILKTFLRCLSWRFLWTQIIREPGAKLIPRSFDVADYIFRCLNRMARHSLLRENPFANLLFQGRYGTDCVLPIHLREANFDQIRKGLDRVEIVSESIDSFLFRNLAKFDAFSLSDFSSYATTSLYHKIWGSVTHSARPDARFCERFFLVKPERFWRGNDDLNLRVNKSRNHPLESKLFEMDHTCMYSFHAGTVNGMGAMERALSVKEDGWPY